MEKYVYPATLEQPSPQTTRTPFRLRFPSELLLEIFKFAAAPFDLPYPTYAHWTYPGFTANWLSITVVCRRWRRLACSTSSLWSIVAVYNNPAWLNVVLPRSGCLSVDLVFHRNDSVPSCLDALRTHSSRIRKLFFLSPDLPSYLALAALSSIQMPMLEEVHCGQWDHAFLGAIDGGFTFDHIRFPALTTFRGASMQVDWDARIIRQLTTISIMDAPEFRSGYTLDDFLDVLEQLSDGPLSHLELSNAFPFFDGHSLITLTPEPSTRTVVLPKLLSLSLAHTRPAVILVFLSSIQLSPKVDVTINVTADAGDLGVDPLFGLFDVLPSSGAPSLPIYDTAIYGHVSARRNAVQPFDQIQVTCRTEASIGGKLSLTLAVVESTSPREWMYSFADAVEDFATIFGRAKLESLELSIEDTIIEGEVGDGTVIVPKHHITTDGLLNLFTTFPDVTSFAVRVLDMQWSCPVALVDALWAGCKYGLEGNEATFHSSDGSAGRGSLLKVECPLPRLRTLRIEDCSCHVDFMKSLQLCLWGRGAFSKLPLEKVVIELVQLPQCDTASTLVFCALMKQLAEVVGQVHVLFRLSQGPGPDPPILASFIAAPVIISLIPASHNAL